MNCPNLGKQCYIQIGLIMAVLLLSNLVWSAPATFSYQGRIVGSNGQPLEYASVSFEFTVTSPDGTCVLYKEQRDGLDMRNSKGVFETPIGSGTKSYPAAPSFTLLDAFDNTAALTCSGGATYTPAADDGRRLRVQFYDGTGWRVISPDSVIRSVPYAGFAASSLKLGGKTAGEFVLKTSIPSCAANQVLTYDGTTITCVADQGGAGTVTSVSGSGAISVTGTTSVTVSATTGTTAGTLAAGDDSRFTDSRTPTGSAGGDLTGTYPNPTITANAVTTAKINNSAVTSAKILDATVATADLAAGSAAGQVFRFDGTAWQHTKLGYTDLVNGNGVSPWPTGSCTAGQFITWVSVLDGFTCSNISSSAITTALGFTPGDFKADGSVAMTGVFKAANGSAAAPSILFANDPSLNTGFFFAADDAIGISHAGTETIRITGGGMQSQTSGSFHVTAGNSASTVPYGFSGDTNTGMFRSAADTVAFAAGGVKAFEMNTVVSGVNYVSVTPAATGSSPAISATGSDTNINLTLTPKGTGHLEVAGQVKITGGTPGAGKVLTSDATGLATWETPSSSGGTVTSVTAGTGIVTSPGAGITATGSVAVDVGTGANQIPQLDASGKLLAAVLPSVVVTTSTTLGGDLSGTLPNPTVAKIQTRAVASTAPSDGQALLWDNGNTTWTPQYVRMQDIRNAWGGTQMIPSSACAASESMVWSVVTDRFACQAIGSLNASAITAGTIATARLGSGTADNTTYLRGDGTWSTVASGTGDFKADGSVAMTGQFKGADGTAAAPSISFTNDLNSGLFMYMDNAVGIATNGVHRASLTNAALRSETTSGPMLSWGGLTAGSPSFSFNNDTDTGIFRAAADSLAFTTAATERMRIDSTGNVGLGITVPGANLHVADTASGGTPMIRVSGSGGAIAANIGDSSATAGIESGFMSLGYEGTTQVYVNANGSTYFNGGDVGIGTNSPWGPLDIVKDGGSATVFVRSFGGTAGVQTARANGTSAASTYVSANDKMAQFTAIDGKTAGGEAGLNIFASEVHTATAHGMYLTLNTVAAGTSTSSERVRVSASGDVGIGQNNPTMRLEVYDNVANDYTAMISNASATGHGLYVNAGPTSGTGTIPFQVTSYDGSVNHFYVNSDGGYYFRGSAISTKESKRDIASFDESAQSMLENIQVVKYRYKVDSDERAERIGFLANDENHVYDDRLTNNKRGFATDTIVGVMIKAFQEVYQKIENIVADLTSQSERIDKLEAENAELKARLDRLEKAMVESQAQK